MNAPLPKPKYLDAVVSWHINRWWAFSRQDNVPLYPIHYKCIEIFPTCIVYYRKKETDAYKIYSVIQIMTINEEKQVTIENKEGRLTDKLSNCSRIIQGQQIRGFMIKDEDDTKSEEELTNGEFHKMKQYFHIEERKEEDNAVLAKVIMESVQESMTNSKNIIECLKQKGYKLVKE